jgi:cytochrome c oxidase subunit I+III
VHDNFPPDHLPGPGVGWPVAGALLTSGAWALTMAALRSNRADAPGRFYVAAAGGALLALAGAAALLAGPWLSGLDPATHVYAASVWLLAAWTAAHLVVGVLMQLYCLARRAAGRMTARHDIDIENTVLFWHFCWFTTLVTVAVVAGFPLVA